MTDQSTKLNIYNKNNLNVAFKTNNKSKSDKSELSRVYKLSCEDYIKPLKLFITFNTSKSFFQFRYRKNKRENNHKNA